MARIRTIKPDFFRHEELQDLEAKHRGKYPMLVFAGLWTVCDKSGRFEWRPRQLKLDILPFLNFEMEETLSILKGAGFLFEYEADGKRYGIIPTFPEHQRITGKEAQSPDKYPEPPEDYQRNNREAPETLPGINGDVPDVQEGKGKRKGKRKGNGNSPGVSPEEKRLFLEDVRLTEKQHAALLQKFGEPDTLKAIEYLNNYKLSKGKKYDSDYHTILNWVMERVRTDNGRGNPGGPKAAIGKAATAQSDGQPYPPDREY